MKQPKFWYQEKSILSLILTPIAKLYGFITLWKLKHGKNYKAKMPVICVGNVNIGGTGKTPICLALADYFQNLNKPICFLNHGYKAILQNVVVDLKIHTAFEVGDEAILLAQKAPTIVAHKRIIGAKIAEKKDFPCIIMDDGLQHPTLQKTFSFLVIDGPKGLGNYKVIPAGPLREPLETALKRTNAVIIAGQDMHHIKEVIRTLSPHMPILTGSFQASLQNTLKNKEVVAFAGLGNPEKFFQLLKNLSCKVVQKIAFPDHYFYTAYDIENLLQMAGDLPLITTTKDASKIPPKYLPKIHILTGNFVFDDMKALDTLFKGIY